MYYRLIITNNIKGGSTNKENIIGEVTKGGFSSKLSFLGHLIEETKIRIHNKQNLIIVVLIFINAILKFFKKKII